MLSEKAKEARRAYKKAWAKKNPERVKAHNEKYWERMAQKAAALEKEQK